MPWHINRVVQRGKVYIQAVNRNAPNSDGKYTVGLGYLAPHGDWTEDALTRAVKAMDAAGDRIWTLPLHSIDDHGDRFDPVDEARARKESIKDFATDAGIEGAKLEKLLGPTTGDLTQMTFGVFVELHFKKMRPQEVSAATWRSEEERLPRLLSHFKDKRLRSLDTLGWVEYLRGPAAMTQPRVKGRGAHKNPAPTPTSPRTKALLQALYKEVLKLAVLFGAIKEVHRFPTIKGVTKGVLEVTPLTAGEVLALMEHATSPMYRCLIAVGAGAALRPGELMRMRWEDVRWDHEFLVVRGTKTAKSGDPIPLIPFVKRELASWWEACGRPTEGLLYSYRGKPLKSFDVALRKAAVLAGVADGERRIHMNVLRHTFATLAATSVPPVPLPTAQAIMRHSDTTMLLRVYTHAGVQVQREGLANFPLR